MSLEFSRSFFLRFVDVAQTQLGEAALQNQNRYPEEVQGEQKLASLGTRGKARASLSWYMCLLGLSCSLDTPASAPTMRAMWLVEFANAYVLQRRMNP